MGDAWSLFMREGFGGRVYWRGILGLREIVIVFPLLVFSFFSVYVEWELSFLLG